MSNTFYMVFDDALLCVISRSIQNNDGCWLAKTKNSGGYGITKFQGRRWLLHRLSYTAFIGELSNKLQIHHKCLNQACCNPSHLEALTPKEHKARHCQLQKFCKYGHCFIKDPPYIWKNGKKQCRVCAKRKYKLSFYKERRKELENKFTVVQLERLTTFIDSLVLVNNSLEFLKIKQKLKEHALPGPDNCIHSDYTLAANYPVATFIYKGIRKQDELHVFSYLIFKEEFIRDKENPMHIHHKCRNTRCWNPNHLELLTVKEHTTKQKYTHCINGHEVNDKNTYTNKKTGFRRCRVCNKEAHLRRRVRLKNDRK